MIETRLTVRDYEIASAALEASGVHVSLIDGRIVKKVSSTDEHTQVINRLIAFMKTGQEHHQPRPTGRLHTAGG